MQESKHIEALNEVIETIQESLGDPRGLLTRQRRLMSMLSLGAQHIVELYLHKLNAIKPGVQIKHEWLKLESRNLKLRLAGALTKSLANLKQSNRIFALARDLEQDRNDIVYGAPLSDEIILKEKIDLFLELKKAVESVVGDLL